MKSDKQTNNQFNKPIAGIMHHNLPCCGRQRWFISILLIIRLIIFGQVVLTCPYCHQVKRYVLISHIVSDPTPEIKKMNNELKTRSIEVWKKS